MKKALKILLYIFVLIAIFLGIGITYFYIQFNNFEPESNFEVKTENLEYYNNSYDESRMDFLKKANELKEKYPEIKIFNFYVESKIDDSLSVDFCYIPGKDSTKLMTLSSGVHGVEGFVGNAMQLYFMGNYINDEFLAKSGILLIHSVNPYGFKYGRRVSENNVDLNRNSDTETKLYETINTGYPEVYSLINPKGELDTESFANKFFFVKAIKNIAEKGMPVLRQAILQGQYQFPEGLYFGGKTFEPQIIQMKPILDSICKPYKTIFSIDLHTGYGERGTMHLFPLTVEQETKEKMETVFESFKIDWGDSGDFYTVTGDFVNFIGKVNAEKVFIPMTFEFGTMNSSTTMGSLKSIHIMIMENQGMQYGYKSSADSLKAKEDILEMYFPKSEAWRSQAVEEFSKVMNVSVPRFLETDFTEN